MDIRGLFDEAVQKSTSLPQQVRDRVADAKCVEEHHFDETYIEFLDTMIQLSPRGPEWTKLLEARRTAYLPYCGAKLVRGNIDVGKSCFTIDVSPDSRSVFYWEVFDRA